MANSSPSSALKAAAIDSHSSAAENPSVEASFEPYGKLLRMLMPTLRGVVVHDGYANLVWASDEWTLDSHPEVVNGAIQNALADREEFAGQVSTLDEDSAVYSFAIRGQGTDLRGVVSLVVRITGTMTDIRPIAYVRQLVQPALECLGRELALRAQLGYQQQALGGRERDLTLMLEMSTNRPAADSDADEFDLILKTAIEHMRCKLTALWVPDKNIELALTQSGKPMAPEMLKAAQKHLLAWMQLQQRTIVVNRVAKAESGGGTPYKILACPVRHPSERVMGVLALFNPPTAADFDPHQTRIAELLAKKVTVIIQSQYDSGTGLLTRQAFERQVNHLLTAPPPQLPHCILYLDIDRLHVINETFGMHVGDEVIVAVADTLAKTLPRGSLSARISGDRLAALVPQVGTEVAAQVGESIRTAIAAIVPRTGQETFDVSASLGVAPIGRSDNALAHALATAEIACKAAKDRGRNRVEIFQDSDQSIIRRHTDVHVIGQLRDALDHDKFRLDAQPILPLGPNFGRPRFELLIRMIGERDEIIPPSKFLSAAERYQLMPAIDRWVVRHACSVLGAHGEVAGREFGRFAINLSGHSLQEDTFLAYVLEQIETTKVPPDMLCFELTETATIGNLAKAQHFMKTLQARGCQFALDDFGTGVSSLAYLRDLSVNYLKIDGSFVRDALSSTRSESMIKAIAQLAKVMNMETIAEYVETDNLRVRMAELGVDYGQGFAVGRSQPLKELLQDLEAYQATGLNLELVDDPGIVLQLERDS